MAYDKSKPSNATIRRMFRQEGQKESFRRKHGLPQTEICEALSKDLFVLTDPAAKRRKFQKATSTKINTALAILNSGITPLGIMHEMLLGEREFDPEVLEVCKAVAPYVHPKLSAIALQVGDGTMTHEDALKALDKLPAGRQVAAALGDGEALEEELNELEKETTSGDPEVDNQ